MPALCAKVPFVSIARLTQASPWPDQLLAALELGGVDAAFSLEPAQAPRLSAEFARKNGPGALLYLGQEPSYRELAAALAGQAPLWLAAPAKIGIFADDETCYDFQILQDSLPGLDFELWGRAAKPASFKPARRRGDFAAFQAEAYPVALVPEALAGDALETSQLVLTPGQEGCWFWPRLGLDFFRFSRLALGGH